MISRNRRSETSARAGSSHRTARPLLGALAGVVLYLEILVASLATGGTTSWAYPDASCEQTKVQERGVAVFPDCPSAAGTRWAQRAVNWPAQALRSYLPALGVAPQELRLPPHGDREKRIRWRAWSWLLAGAWGYAMAGAVAAVVGMAMRGRLRRRRAPSKATAGGRGPRITRMTAMVTGAATCAFPMVWLIARGPADDAREVAYEAPTLRPLTRGPAQHFFGYYDKLQFDPTDRHVLGMATRTGNRLVVPADRIEIGMIDLDAPDPNWTALGESSAWNWQQGCMLQWLPARNREIIWNDREVDADGARLVSRILDVDTRLMRTLDSPIYTVAPDGASALSINFSRLQRARPTYGYVGLDDPSEGTLAPVDDGVFSVDLTGGETRLILSIADAVAFGRSTGYAPKVEHYLEMLQFNPSGTRFVFFERWIADTLKSRVLTANIDGTELFLVSNAPGNLSHVAWLDDTRLTVYSSAHGGYTTFEDLHGYDSMLLETSRDGHQSFVAGGEWMLSDTYGDDDDLQHPFLHHLPTGTTVAVAHLMAHASLMGDLRCDNHPRVSRDGRKVIVDSAHAQGRQMYLIDIGPILDAYSASPAP